MICLSDLQFAAWRYCRARRGPCGSPHHWDQQPERGGSSTWKDCLSSGHFSRRGQSLCLRPDVSLCTHIKSRIMGRNVLRLFVCHGILFAWQPWKDWGALTTGSSCVKSSEVQCRECADSTVKCLLKWCYTQPLNLRETQYNQALRVTHTRREAQLREMPVN